MQTLKRLSLTATLAGVKIGEGLPVRLMAALNVSPESFYKGSVHTDPGTLVAAAQAMARCGADFIDIGAMSTAPYLSGEISEEEEKERLAQAVAIVAQAVPVPLSADTQRSIPARAAIAAGARIINDVSGLKQDPEMAPLVAETGVGLIVAAHEEIPQPGTPMERIVRALEASLNLALKSGIPEERIVVDPGIGFFRKTGMPWDEWDVEVIRRLGELRILGRPILVGLSRKSFIGKILGQRPPEERLFGSLAAAAIAAYNGAHMIRAHDVLPTRDVLRLAERLRPPW